MSQRRSATVTEVEVREEDDDDVAREGVEAVEEASSWDEDEAGDCTVDVVVVVTEALEVFFGLRSCN